MIGKIFLFVNIFIFNIYFVENSEVRKFSDSLKFGASTSSYQIEGGWNTSDKSENIWDRFTHSPNNILDNSNGDIACDSYNQIKRDLEMIQELNLEFYRFSISWSRLLPDAFAGKISEDGRRYYNELIDGLLSIDVTPIVTIYHWDLPQKLQNMGGWVNPLMINYVTDYAKVVFDLFGDRVKYWLTFNEPSIACFEGYGEKLIAPALNLGGIADYLCAHNMIKAHAKIYHLYDEIYRPVQKGRISWTLNAIWVEPISSQITDVEAADRIMQFYLGWFAHPVFSKNGDYPYIMKHLIAKKSRKQGFAKSRLPKFTREEVNYIKGTYDFFGLNYYTSFISTNKLFGDIPFLPQYINDFEAYGYQDPRWPSSASIWLKVTPWGLTKLLNWIKNEYDNPEIMITENGYSDTNGTKDTDRINYHNEHLNALLDAIEMGCNVTLYSVWSLMDNFEWRSGYLERFGLYYVDFEDPKRTRTAKDSAFYYRDLILTRTLRRNL